MFAFMKKKKTGNSITFRIDGMHCMSCSMNIDGSLEDSEGVFEATTTYAQGKSAVRYDADKTTPEKLQEIISGLGYTATVEK